MMNLRLGRINVALCMAMLAIGGCGSSADNKADDAYAKEELGETGIMVDGEPREDADPSLAMQLYSDSRQAHSIRTLRKQLNELYPGRKLPDGTIGDKRHQNSNSDHNPWIVLKGIGIVTAVDVSDGPDEKFSVTALAEKLRLGQDPRIKYLIFSGRIFSSKRVEYKGAVREAWTWGSYRGKNPHKHHMHLSVSKEEAQFDDERPWKLK